MVVVVACGGGGGVGGGGGGGGGGVWWSLVPTVGLGTDDDDPSDAVMMLKPLVHRQCVHRPKLYECVPRIHDPNDVVGRHGVGKRLPKGNFPKLACVLDVALSQDGV
jgi:hypothetical protein